MPPYYGNNNNNNNNNSNNNELWQDRDIKFDSGPNFLTLRRGEYEIEKLNQVNTLRKPLHTFNNNNNNNK